MERIRPVVILASTFIFLPFFFVPATRAAEFRIDNEVRPGEVRSTTYLLDGDFYSMIGQNGEITYYDAKAKTFTIMDPALRIQTRIDLEETKKRVETIRRQALEHPKFEPGTFNAFVVKPTFQAEFDEISGDLALRSTYFDYVMETSGLTDAETARLFFEFCDLSCYLNFRISKSRAMLVRLEVNRILAANNRFPRKISASIFPNGKGPLAKVEKAESVHKLVLRLTEEDQRRIAQAKESMRTFTVAPFSEYELKVAEKAAPK